MATCLGLAFRAAGHTVLQVWSRQHENARSLADRLGAQAISGDFDQLTEDASVYIMAVVDDAICQLADKFPFKDRILVHTSGATAMGALSAGSARTGVLYPLQTLSKFKSVDFLDVPVGIEASDPEVYTCLEKLSSSISEKVYSVNSAQRQALHLAAVLACNFTNHLYALAEKMLADNQLDFDLLRPLISETAQKAMFFSPAKSQTGPAARHDMGTINKHLQMLSADEKLMNIYRLLTDSIIKS